MIDIDKKLLKEFCLGRCGFWTYDKYGEMHCKTGECSLFQFLGIDIETFMQNNKELFDE